MTLDITDATTSSISFFASLRAASQALCKSRNIAWHRRMAKRHAAMALPQRRSCATMHVAHRFELFPLVFQYTDFRDNLGQRLRRGRLETRTVLQKYIARHASRSHQAHLDDGNAIRPRFGGNASANNENQQ